MGNKNSHCPGNNISRRNKKGVQIYSPVSLKKNNNSRRFFFAISNENRINLQIAKFAAEHLGLKNRSIWKQPDNGFDFDLMSKAKMRFVNQHVRWNVWRPTLRTHTKSPEG